MKNVILNVTLCIWSVTLAENQRRHVIQRVYVQCFQTNWPSQIFLILRKWGFAQFYLNYFVCIKFRFIVKHICWMGRTPLSLRNAISLQWFPNFSNVVLFVSTMNLRHEFIFQTKPIKKTLSRFYNFIHLAIWVLFVKCDWAFSSYRGKRWDAIIRRCPNETSDMLQLPSIIAFERFLLKRHF